MKVTNLKEAQKQGKLEAFIKEREKETQGDETRLAKTITSMACGKKKSEQETSGQDSSES